MPAYCEWNQPVPQPMLGTHAKQLSNFDHEPIPLISETKYRNKLREGKHQNILSGVPIEQRVFYTCVETRRKSAPADTWVQFP